MQCLGVLTNNLITDTSITKTVSNFLKTLNFVTTDRVVMHVEHQKNA